MQATYLFRPLTYLTSPELASCLEQERSQVKYVW